ncbi:acyltransferase domain-containing protein [Micromonospora sp. WMMA1998]|uniref:acyltransferase domain-containing protein n=1 Tax=unclassified Micromonospora TaxID=2617518 RepID=UPI00248C9D96|nr:acyltransferase domain-containing protein [Micromonospora sp. WMMA1998]WBC16756.1 acyltransferase domain-containing protein [Micromonospora sp. WMMA1998]
MTDTTNIPSPEATGPSTVAAEGWLLRRRPGAPDEDRVVALGRDAAHCTELLDGGDSWLVARGRPVPPASVVLMFPGVGDQRPGLSRDLYHAVPAYRAELDRVSEMLRPLLDQDLRELLLTDESGPTGWSLRELLQRDAGGPLSRTSLAQPLVFALEYCLARLLLHWGVRPAVLVGYSIGEYVAACVAGVLDIRDALTLVTRRAALIEEVPAGAMLVVMLDPGDLAEHLGDDLWLAAVNGAGLCQVSGTPSAVARLAERLTSAGVATLPAPARHAFHSPLMDPVARPLERLLENIPLTPPSIPVLSNVTGDWLTDEESCSPGYWARHLCQPVQFAGNLARMWGMPRVLAVEVGAGQMLTSLANQHPARPRGPGTPPVVATLTSRGNDHGEVAAMARVLAHAWANGAWEPTAAGSGPADAERGKSWTSR